VKKLFLFVIIRARNSRHFLCDQAVGDRIADPDFLNHFSRLLNWVNRCGKDLDLFLFEFLGKALKVSQLLIAERSPMTAVDQDYPVPLPDSFRKFQLFSRDQLQLHPGKHIVGI
jgi:hypothetical protein